ncbi:MAG: 4Fe-4S binding protein, partial [Gemmatimonadales bacterium]
YEITRHSLVKAALRNRWPQLLVTTTALGGLVLVITAGLVGTPVGNRNIAIVGVWIAWWALLMLMAVPVLGRGWCTVCPIPVPGEWLQRGGILKPTAALGLGVGRRWPRAVRNMWLQNAAFVLLALLSIVILTQPLATAVVLLALLAIATAAALLFERRAFCRYLCPVGGFIGLYSQLAPLELRVKDKKLCAGHNPKTCYVGDDSGCGCPWYVYPGALAKNTYCGLCLECIRTCPYDNVALNLRPPGADLLIPQGRRLDEAYKAFIMLGSAIAYALVMLGPWGTLKVAAYSVGSAEWILYALGFLLFTLVVLPGGFLMAVILGRRLSRPAASLRSLFIRFSYALIPLGLAAWIAFSISFVLANLSYLWPVLSDPLGWGWDLLGTEGVHWTPYLAGVAPSLQVVVLLTGFAWGVRTGGYLAREIRVERSRAGLLLPVVGCSLLITLGLIGVMI